MEVQDLPDLLDAIEQRYFDSDEDRAVAIEGFRELHFQVIADAILREEFEFQVLTKAGGEYIPHVFWLALGQFLRTQQAEGRGQLFECFKALVESNFSDELKAELKPLVVVYIANEKQFELDRLMSHTIAHAHPQVREYMDKLIQFVPKNQHSVNTYKQKFDLLRDTFPDFERFGLPLPRLQEELA